MINMINIKGFRDDEFYMINYKFIDDITTEKNEYGKWFVSIIMTQGDPIKSPLFDTDKMARRVAGNVKRAITYDRKRKSI